MKVHNTLGNGFSIKIPSGQGVIYQHCLAIEMEKRGLSLVRELEMPIYYDRVEVGTRRVDFLVGGKVLVELKAVIKLEDVHLAQALNYQEAFKLKVGLLINFDARSLEYKRLMKVV